MKYYQVPYSAHAVIQKKEARYLGTLSFDVLMSALLFFSSETHPIKFSIQSFAEGTDCSFQVIAILIFAIIRHAVRNLFILSPRSVHSADTKQLTTE